MNPQRERLISKEDALLISHIADRAVLLADSFGRRFERTSMLIDLAIAHRVCPLDLQRLLDADDGNFAHDVFGIMRHLDRTTGKLRDCFLPRTARMQHELDSTG